MSRSPDLDPRGLILRCDAGGGVLEVLRNDVGLTPTPAPGQPFEALVDAMSAEKARRFLATADADGSALDWELNVATSTGLLLLHFVAVRDAAGLLIAGARSRVALQGFYEGLVEIGNEQVNQVRAMVQERAASERAREMKEAQYDNLTRLNNELMAAQRELAKRNAELDALNAQKNQFLGMAAHDLRNPLGVILAYSEILIDEGRERFRPDENELLEAIHDSSQFMLRLVEELLDIAKIESGTLHLDLKEVDLAALVRQTVSRNQRLAVRKGISLSVECGPDIGMVLLDAGKIEQVVNNLLTNAIKFSPGGTAVSLTLARGDGGILLSVSDQGPGIPASEHQKIFQPFARAKSVQTTAGESSTGLGLAIVRKLVEGHGGRIWVESEVGHGSTFHVLLPEKEPANGRIGGRDPG